MIRPPRDAGELGKQRTDSGSWDVSEDRIQRTQLKRISVCVNSQRPQPVSGKVDIQQRIKKKKVLVCLYCCGSVLSYTIPLAPRPCIHRIHLGKPDKEMAVLPPSRLSVPVLLLLCVNLLLRASPVTGACQFTDQNGVDAAAGDIAPYDTHFGVDLAACKQLCLDSAACVALSVRGIACNLYDALPPTQPSDPADVFSTKSCTAASSTTQASTSGSSESQTSTSPTTSASSTAQTTTVGSSESQTSSSPTTSASSTTQASTSGSSESQTSTSPTTTGTMAPPCTNTVLSDTTGGDNYATTLDTASSNTCRVLCAAVDTCKVASYVIATSTCSLFLSTGTSSASGVVTFQKNRCDDGSDCCFAESAGIQGTGTAALTFSATAASCQSLCESVSGCVAATFKSGKCFLYSQSTGTSALTGSTHVVKTCSTGSSSVGTMSTCSSAVSAEASTYGILVLGLLRIMLGV